MSTSYIENRYLTTENIRGSRFSKHFYEDVEYLEKHRIPARIEFNWNGGGSIRMTMIDGSMLPVSKRQDWTHGNSGKANIVSDEKVMLNSFPDNLFEL